MTVYMNYGCFPESTASLSRPVTSSNGEFGDVGLLCYMSQSGNAVRPWLAHSISGGAGGEMPLPVLIQNSIHYTLSVKKTAPTFLTVTLLQIVWFCIF